MNNSKSLLVLVLAASFVVANCWEECFSVKEKRKIKSLNMLMQCKGPKAQIVEVPIPDGFDSVNPSIVKVARCDKAKCMELKKSCMATETMEMPVKVEATKLSMDGMTEMEKCTTSNVTVHLGCGCQCVTKKDECKGNQMFNEKMCMCVCDPEKKAECISGGESRMWRGKTCECVCRPKECEEGTKLNEETCRCKAD